MVQVKAGSCRLQKVEVELLRYTGGCGHMDLSLSCVQYDISHQIGVEYKPRNVKGES